MFRKSPSGSGIFRPRIFGAFLLFSTAICLATFAINDLPRPERADRVPVSKRFMPAPGGDPDDLDRMESEWNNRLTYPTGIFNPAWVRLAAAADARMAR
ncbi:MAG: hypothetical protein QOD64_718, partial [Verrucomicrobiota bacterium]